MPDLRVRAIMTGDATQLVGAVRQLETAVSRFQQTTEGTRTRVRAANTALNEAGDAFRRHGASVGFFDQKLGQVGNRLVSVRNLFGPLLAAFSAGSIVSFGTNIAQNFDKITEKANELGIAVDSKLIAKMEEASRRGEAAWLRLSLAAAPYIAAVENAAAATLELINRQNELARNRGAAGDVGGIAGYIPGVSFLRGLANPPPARKPTDIENEFRPGTVFGKYGIPFRADAGTAFGGSGIPTLADVRATNAARDDFAENQVGLMDKAREDAKKIADAANEARAQSDRFYQEQKRRSSSQQILEQLENDQASIEASKKLDETIQKIHDDALGEMSGANKQYFEERARLEEQESRRFRQFTSQALDLALDFGNVMDQSGGKFIKAVGSMVLSLTQLILKLELTRALEASIGSGSSGGGSFSSILSGIGSFLGLSGGAGIGAGNSAGVAFANVAHGGGTFGSDSFAMRSVPMSAFANAPRFHSGGEVPVIAQAGETVFTKGQMAALGGALNRAPQVIVNIATPEGTSARVNQRASGNGDLQVDVLVEQVDRALGQRIAKGQSQIGQTMEGVYSLRRQPTR